LNAANRLNNIAESFIDSKAKKILIDHHLEPENFCDGYFTDTEITATGVLIYDILKNSDKEYVFSKSQADALYTAIMTDTGSFRFPKTDAQTHRLIAELIDAGAEPFMLYDQVYNQFPISALRIKARAYSKIEIFLDGKFCLTTVTRKDFEETGALEEETEALVESLLSVQGIYFAGLLIESTESEHVRCSFRAKNGYEVRSLAVSFGGGGHAQAAGARIKDKTLVLAKAEIINYVLNNYQ
jgi:phosphoesterase RecJ-like protein